MYEIPESAKKQADDAYRAIGRYIVEFSELVWAMRGMVEDHINGPLAGQELYHPPRVGESVKLLLGEATAQYVADVFFAICREVGDFDQDEIDVTNALSEAVNREIKRRNDIAHGDWVVWFPGFPSVGRTRPARKKQPRRWIDYPSEALERISDEVGALASSPDLWTTGTWTVDARKG